MAGEMLAAVLDGLGSCARLLSLRVASIHPGQPPQWAVSLAHVALHAVPTQTLATYVTVRSFDCVAIVVRGTTCPSDSSSSTFRFSRSPLVIVPIARPHFYSFFFFNDPAPPEISPLPLHDPLPISPASTSAGVFGITRISRASLPRTVRSFAVVTPAAMEIRSFCRVSA